MKDDNPHNGGNNYNKKRAESFQLHISEDDLNGVGDDLYSIEYNDSGEDSSQTINSYSTQPPKTPEQIKEQKLTEKQMKKAQKFRSKEKGRHNKWVFRWVWIAMVVLIGIGLAQFLVSGVNDMLAVNRAKVTVTVEIPKNPTTQQIAQILHDNGVIDKPDFFTLFSKLTKADGHYGNGTYKISTNMDYEELINNLQSYDSRVDTVKVTFPEGMNMLEMAQLLDKKGVCTSKELLEAANSDKFDDYSLIGKITNGSSRYYKLEGYLFPDTYEFYKSEKPEDVLGKMINNCEYKLNKTIQAKAAKSGMTVDQLLTLASLIQAESADETDMYNVSSVLHNRLKDGASHDIFTLQCDSTKYYPYRQLSLVPSDIRPTFKSRYDTYTVKGLPAGPICNPGDTAIDAALNPNDTNYFYFCHDKDKNAYYARTKAGHDENLKKAGLTK